LRVEIHCFLLHLDCHLDYVHCSSSKTVFASYALQICTALLNILNLEYQGRKITARLPGRLAEWLTADSL
ncbi:MAG: hypothetical protein MUO31_10395, partial [Thermodesulfovibrionales bacterium]|nr:hypothetical protein [Thermodesulfovibrionales bacterium]